MKALTLWRPWAYIIAHRGKRVENRTWKPPQGLIGQRIALHQGQKWAPPDAWGLPRDIDCGDALLTAIGILATARLVGVVSGTNWGNGMLDWKVERGRVPEGGWTEESHGRWFHGPFGWVLEDVKAVGPFECKGAQGLWTLGSAVEELLPAGPLTGQTEMNL